MWGNSSMLLQLTLLIAICHVALSARTEVVRMMSTTDGAATADKVIGRSDDGLPEVAAAGVRHLAQTTCPTGTIKNTAGKCVCRKPGQVYKPKLLKCTCPYSGQKYSTTTKKCYCPAPSKLISGKCQVPPTPTPTPVPIGSSSGVPDMWKPLLDAHNTKRARHGTPPLVWSATLASHAQTWVEKIQTKRCDLLDHGTDADAGSSGKLGEGENLYARGSYASGELQTAVNQAMGGWYDKEEPKYKYTNGGFSMDTGHFTQVVWKDTKQVGCGITKGNCKSDGYYWVTISCRYSPPGNYEGQYKINVPMPLAG